MLRLQSSLTVGSWAAAAADKSLFPGLLGDPLSAAGEPSTWAKTVAKMFLQPFGVGNPNSIVSAAGTKGDILLDTRLKLLPLRVNVACTSNRPYPIIVAAVMLPGKVSPKLFPYEFTPLYSGIASLAEGLKPVTLGGGYMEPFGLNTVAPSKKVVSRDGSGAVEVTALRTQTVSSLMHAVGTSSSAVALMMKPDSLLLSNLFNGQMRNYWNVWDYQQSMLSFLDGSAVDDLAMLPLLRQRVKNIIAAVAVHTGPDMSLEGFAAEEYALAGLFGALPSNGTDSKGKPLLVNGVDTPAAWNSMQQVFPIDGFANLFNKYKASWAAGGPHIWTVVRNTFLGIAGGYTVNILWILNGKSTSWESLLPQITSAWLNSQRKVAGPYKDYPNIVNVLQAPP